MCAAGFRLQSVLDYRQQIVELRQGELAALQRSLQEAERLLREIEGRWRALAGEVGRAQQQGVLDCGELCRLLAYLELLRHRREEAEIQVAELVAKMEEKRAELLRAMQDKQTLEKLKEKQLELQKREELYQEGKRLDEISVVRFRHRDDQRSRV